MDSVDRAGRFPWVGRLKHTSLARRGKRSARFGRSHCGLTAGIPSTDVCPVLYKHEFFDQVLTILYLRSGAPIEMAKAISWQDALVALLLKCPSEGPGKLKSSRRLGPTVSAVAAPSVPPLDPRAITSGGSDMESDSCVSIQL